MIQAGRLRMVGSMNQYLRVTDWQLLGPACQLHQVWPDFQAQLRELVPLSILSCPVQALEVLLLGNPLSICHSILPQPAILCVDALGRNVDAPHDVLPKHPRDVLSMHLPHCYSKQSAAAWPKTLSHQPHSSCMHLQQWDSKRHPCARMSDAAQTASLCGCNTGCAAQPLESCRGDFCPAFMISSGKGADKCGKTACLVGMLDVCEVVEIDHAMAALARGCAVTLRSCEQRPPLPSTGAIRNKRRSQSEQRSPGSALSSGMIWWVCL